MPKVSGADVLSTCWMIKDALERVLGRIGEVPQYKDDLDYNTKQLDKILDWAQRAKEQMAIMAKELPAMQDPIDLGQPLTPRVAGKPGGSYPPTNPVPKEKNQ